MRLIIELRGGPGCGHCVEVLMAAPMPTPEQITFRETPADTPSFYRFSHQREDSVIIYDYEIPNVTA